MTGYYRIKEEMFHGFISSNVRAIKVPKRSNVPNFTYEEALIQVTRI